LNPSSYLYDGWGVSPGSRPASAPVAVKVNSVWLLNSSDGTMKKTYDSLAKPAAKYVPVAPTYADVDVDVDTVSAVNGCTLRNGVKEVFYNIGNK